MAKKNTKKKSKKNTKKKSEKNTKKKSEKNTEKNIEKKRAWRKPAVTIAKSHKRKACGLCGNTKRLIKTTCCGNWICDDEGKYVLFSYGRNSCTRNHRRYTLCGTHDSEGHEGRWQDCAKCRENVETEMYVWYGTNEYNFEKLVDPPEYEPTHCSICQKVIRLGKDGYMVRAGDYWCESCGEKKLGRLF